MPTSSEPLDFHPAAEIFPLMCFDQSGDMPSVHSGLDGGPSDKDFRMAWRDFVADIKAHGQREPGVLFEGKILDGRNRYLACREAGIPFKYREYDEAKEGDHLAFVLSGNLHRRQLTFDQRAALAYEVLAYEATREDRRKRGNPDLIPAPVQELATGEAATRAGRRTRVGARTVYKVKKLAEKDPDVVDKLKRRETTVAAEWNKHQPKERKSRADKRCPHCGGVI